MCFFFAIGMPIAYALALSSLVGALWIDLPVGAVMQQFASGVGKVSMLTIPFFVLAGAIMAEGGMAKRLVAFANVLVGVIRVRGGLSAVNIVATTFLSGISGSSVADVSAIGSVMIPQMEKIGYPRAFATNVTISASVQAILVPPSHNAVIYSLATGGLISITSLFMAGVVPGLLLGAALIGLVIFIGYRDGHPRARRPDAEPQPEDGPAVDMPALDAVVRQCQPAGVPGAAGPPQDGEAGERNGHGAAHHQEDVGVLQQQPVVDRVVVAEPARGQQEPEHQADAERRPAHTAGHSAPPVSACRPRVIATATVKNVAVTATLSGDAAAQPDIPCPDVHPPAHREP